jgi:hypothetical protein
MMLNLFEFFFLVHKLKRCRGVHEKYNSCGTACPKTCEDIINENPFKPCTFECVEGCFCQEGFVRENEEPNSPCVDAEECRSSF